MKFSKQQLEAIETKNTNIVVSASAGAGKTTVLIERLMQRMFSDHLALDEILAVTFTEAAASNMKKKLLKSLYNKLEASLIPVERDFCKKQIVLLNNALICTMHSFLTTIIKENYAAISLDIELVNNIIDEVSKTNFLNEAIDNVIKNELINNFENFNNLVLYSSNDTYNYDTLKNNIIAIFNTANNNLDPESWILNIINKNHIATAFTEIDSDYIYYFFQSILFQIDKCIEDINNMMNCLTLDYQDNIQLFLNINENLNKAKQYLKNDYTKAINYIQDGLQIKTKASFKGVLEYPNFRNEFIKDSNKLVENLFTSSQLLNNYNENCHYQKYLLEIALKVIDAYQNLKIINKCMDFNDMEHYAYKILIANNNEVAIKYQQQFKEIMVDEFQDTNDVQNAMVKLISSGNNVFRVGDIKQSIYKFRNAKPSIMQNLIDNPKYHIIYLPNNYRSNYSIVEFNNELYQQLFSDNNLSIKFKNADLQIADQDYQLKDLQEIELVNLPFNEPDSVYSENNSAIYIANDIIKKHENYGYKFKDFCILLRYHSEKKSLKFVLEKANIPNFIDDHSGFANTKANLIIINYLKLLIDPYDKIALIAILVSPIYQFNDNQLAELKNNNEYFDILKNLNHIFIQDYYSIKEIYNNNGLLSCINAIINLNNFYHQYTSKQDKYDINFLLQNVQDFNSNSILAYLDYIKIASENNKDGAICVSNEDDVVQVMTIHQSKGLEFKVVYLYDYNARNLEKQQNSIIINNDLGIAIKHSYNEFKYTCNTLTWIAIMQLNKLEELSELIRIFYVATTRAKSRLYIISNTSLKKFISQKVSNLLNQQISFVDLLYCTNIIDSKNFKSTTITDNINLETLEKPILANNNINYYPANNNNISNFTPSNHDNLKLSLNFDNKGLEIGTLMHKAMEILPINKTWDYKLIDNTIQGLTNNQKDKLILLYNNPFFKELITKETHREYNFTIYLDNNLITGIIDFLSIDMETVSIIDYKTDIDVNETDLYDMYHKQLLMYKNSFKYIYNDKLINAYIYSFSLNKFIKI